MCPQFCRSPQRVQVRKERGVALRLISLANAGAHDSALPLQRSATPRSLAGLNFQISSFGSPCTIFIVSRLTVMRRRKSSSG